jgi:hypothetical protein
MVEADGAAERRECPGQGRAKKEREPMDIVGVSAAKKWAGIGLILASGLIHLVETPEYLGEMRYIGVLFILSVVGAVAAAIGIARNERWGWHVGLLVAGGSIAAYLLSRTVGLPFFRENSWEAFAEPIGLLSLLVEGLFVAVAASVLAYRSTVGSPENPLSVR